MHVRARDAVDEHATQRAAVEPVVQVIAERDVGAPDLRQTDPRLPCVRAVGGDGDHAVGVDVRRSQARAGRRGDDRRVLAGGRPAPGLAGLGAHSGEPVAVRGATPREDFIAAHDLALPVRRVRTCSGEAGRKPQTLHGAVLVEEGMPGAVRGLGTADRLVLLGAGGRHGLLAAQRAQILERRPVPQERALMAARVLVSADELPDAVHPVCLAIRAKQGGRTGRGVPEERMADPVG